MAKITITLETDDFFAEQRGSEGVMAQALVARLVEYNPHHPTNTHLLPTFRGLTKLLVRTAKVRFDHPPSSRWPRESTVEVDTNWLLAEGYAHNSSILPMTTGQGMASGWTRNGFPSKPKKDAR